MVFSAAFFRRENFEAAYWFLDHVWPIISKSRPDARVRFAGARPPAELLRRADERVEVTGFLNQITDGYVDGLLAIAPLRRGAGLKFKVVQALAMGFPIVGTSVAMEGLDDVLGRSVSVFDSAEAFAGEVLRILDSPMVVIEEAAREVPVVRERIDFGVRMRELSADFEGLAGAQS
ncbi:glycosyltransferase family 4 protein [Nocardioides faecalis]|uniref:glycosyltransferase family 4 protein n=1 Tax=Nocardioides faecalis TaxID=2803858 RepID=UPI002017B119|nr:glycosyltransferase family 4 protein [Nocardioides faecalis]